MARAAKDTILPIQRVTVRNNYEIENARTAAYNFLEWNAAETPTEIRYFVNTSKTWEYLAFLFGEQNPEQITRGTLGGFYRFKDGEVVRVEAFSPSQADYIPVSEQESEAFRQIELDDKNEGVEEEFEDFVENADYGVEPETE